MLGVRSTALTSAVSGEPQEELGLDVMIVSGVPVAGTFIAAPVHGQYGVVVLGEGSSLIILFSWSPKLREREGVNETWLRLGKLNPKHDLPRGVWQGREMA